MARTGARRPGYKVESRGLPSLLEDPSEEQVAFARKRERRAAISKRKRPDRKRELEMIDEFIASQEPSF